MRRKFERLAVLVVLIGSPFWLPHISPRLGGSFRMGLVGAFEPLLNTVQSAGVGFRNLTIGFLRGPMLLEENHRLRAQLETLLAHEETHRQLFEENARLRELIHLEKQLPWKVITAEVIGREWGIWTRSLLVNKGTQDGVQVGQAVITPVGLIGRVSEVGPSSSRILLMIDPHFRIQASVAQSGTAGLVMGTSAGDCLLTYLPNDAELKVGDSVRTAGGRSFCPEGVPIGVVRVIFEDSSKLYRSARIQPSVHLGDVEEVLVVS